MYLVLFIKLLINWSNYNNIVQQAGRVDSSFSINKANLREKRELYIELGLSMRGRLFYCC